MLPYLGTYYNTECHKNNCVGSYEDTKKGLGPNRGGACNIKVDIIGNLSRCGSVNEKNSWNNSLNTIPALRHIFYNAMN